MSEVIDFYKIILTIQGSQGLVALRELFGLGFSPNKLEIIVCKKGGNLPLIKFLEFNKLNYIYVCSSEELDNHLDKFQDFENYLLLSIGWKYRFSELTVKNFKNRSLNLHPGILPYYRGSFCTPNAIFNGEKFSGFTYHCIDNDINTGDIVLQKKIPILSYDTSHSLNYRIMQLGLSNIGRAINNIKKQLHTPQLKLDYYYKDKLPNGGILKNTWEKEKKQRFIKAMYFPPYKPAKETINGKTKYYTPDNI